MIFLDSRRFSKDRVVLGERLGLWGLGSRRIELVWIFRFVILGNCYIFFEGLGFLFDKWENEIFL